MYSGDATPRRSPFLMDASVYVITPSPRTATLTMSTLRETLRDLAERLSDENYDESFAQYRFWT